MIKRLGLVLVLAVLQVSCGGDDKEEKGDSGVVKLSGVVSAPANVVAELQPVTLKTMIADLLFGKSLAAVTTGWAVASGVAVQLIEVDGSGAQVGDALVETITGPDGSYSLTLPDGFVVDPKYVVRAGSGATIIDARVTSTSSVDIDPSSDAASDLVVELGNSLSSMTIEELQFIIEIVKNALVNLDAGELSATTISADLITSVKNDEESANVVYSTVSSGTVCGNVKDSTGAALAGIKMVARDYGNWVTRAYTKTDASGNYCMNLPMTGDTNPDGGTFSGAYILGALNYTSGSFAASQWWSASSETSTDGSGGVNSQFKASKVTVANTTQVDKNFYLDANGARVQGTVTTHDSIVPEGVNVLLRDFDTFNPLAPARVKTDGTYRINIKAGDYMLSIRNTTALPYASEIWRDTDTTGAGTTLNARDRNMASRETLTGGTTYNYDVTLEAGELISGTVYSDSSVTTTVSGTPVRIDYPNASAEISNADIIARAGRAEVVRTNKLGKFRFWAYPALYSIRAYGQAKDADLTAVGVSSVNLAFASDVATVSGTVYDEDGATPVAQALMFLRDTGNSDTKEFARSNEDGTFVLHSDATSMHVLFSRLDSDVNYASAVYDGANYTQGTSWDTLGAQISLVVGTNYTKNGSLPTLGGTPGIGYLDGKTVDGGRVIIRDDTVNQNAVVTRARGDGSFKITLPVGSYKIIARNKDDAANLVVCTGATAVNISNGATTTIDVSDSNCP